MKLKKVEVHQVVVTKYFEFDEDEIIENFGSLEQFYEDMEETEEWWDFVNDAECDDRQEDWVSDNKGFTEEHWEIEEE